MTEIYFDTCSLSRLFDESSQERIRVEAAAVQRILSGEMVWIGSDMLADEVSAIKDDEKRGSLLAMLERLDKCVEVTPRIIERAGEIAALGFGNKDAVHIASAESVGAEWLLTTDRRLVRLAKRFKRRLSVAVENPAEWVIRFHTDEDRSH